MARTTGSDELYRLIHALTTEEKGYFKKIAKRHSEKENKHLELFDAINAQKEFSESSLKKQFKGYADMKGYLFEMILQSLMLYHAKAAPLFEMLQKMIYSVILQNKGLQRKALQLNREGLDIASEREFFWLHEQFFRHEMIYTEGKWTNGEQLEKYRESFAEIRRIRDMQDNRDAYILAGHYGLYTKVLETVKGKHGYVLDDLVDIAFLEDKSKVLSPGNERSRMFALGRYYDAKDDYKNAYRVYKELYDFENRQIKSKSSLQSNLYRYQAHRTLITSCLLVKSYNEMPALLDALLHTDQYEKRYEKDARYFYCLRYADYYWQTGKHKQGFDFYTKKLEAILKEHKEDVNSGHRLTLLPRKILFDYSLQKFTEAILGIEGLHADGVKNAAPQFKKEGEWLRLLIHLQTNDWVNVKKYAKALQQEKDMELMQWEKAVVKKLFKIQLKNRNEILKECIEIMEEAEKPLVIFENFKLLTGFKHLLAKKTLAELVAADYKE